MPEQKLSRQSCFSRLQVIFPDTCQHLQINNKLWIWLAVILISVAVGLFLLTHDAHIKSYKPVYQFMAWPSEVSQLKNPSCQGRRGSRKLRSGQCLLEHRIWTSCGCEISVLQKVTRIPKTNSSHLKMGAPWKFWRNRNPPFLGAMLVLGSVCTNWKFIYTERKSLKTSDCHIIVSNTVLPPPKKKQSDNVRHSH